MAVLSPDGREGRMPREMTFGLLKRKRQAQEALGGKSWISYRRQTNELVMGGRMKEENEAKKHTGEENKTKTLVKRC